MKDNLFITASVDAGKLIYPIKANETKLKNFLVKIPDGVKIEIFISVSTDKGSNAQLAKIHTMIREIANELGYTFEEVKLQIKRKTGLCFMKDGSEYCKSFSNCDKEDLNLVIQSCIELGDFCNMNLR